MTVLIMIAPRYPAPLTPGLRARLPACTQTYEDEFFRALLFLGSWPLIWLVVDLLLAQAFLLLEVCSCSQRSSVTHYLPSLLRACTTQMEID